MLHRLKTAPWGKVFRVLAWFVVGFTCLVGIPTAGLHYTDLTHFAADLAVHALVALVIGLQFLLLFTYIWASSDVPGGWKSTKKFFRDFPENWRKFWQTVGVVLAFLWALPGKCLRGLRTAFRWVVSLPGKWRAMHPTDKRATVFMTVGTTVYGIVLYLMWPVAKVVCQYLPSLFFDESSFKYVLIYDMFLSAMAIVIVLSLVGFVVDLLRALMDRLSGRR